MKSCMFLHIPKTGGMSIKHRIGLPKYGHKRYVDLVEEQKEGFVFSIVRNPLDRLVSAFFYDTDNWRYYHSMSKAKEEFAEWVQSIDPHDPDNMERNKGLFPQRYWLEDEDGNIGSAIGFIGLYEELDGAWKFIADRIDAPRELPDRKYNRSDHKHYTEYYTPELEEQVRELYKKDFDTFYSEGGEQD